MYGFIVAIIVVGVLGFLVGSSYGKNNSVQTNATNGTRSGFTGGRGGMMGNRGAGFVTGDILSKDATSITIKTRDGSSKIIFYSPSTEVGKFVTGTMDDLVVGKTVSLNGTANSDGSITAQSIQVRPTN